jgi:hypothetical protein
MIKNDKNNNIVMITMMAREVKQQELHLLQRRDIKLTDANISRRFLLVLLTVRLMQGTALGTEKSFPPFVVMLKSSSEEKVHFVALYWQVKIKVLGENLVPDPLRIPQILLEMHVIETGPPW